VTRTSYRTTFAVLATAVMSYALLQSLVIPVLPTIQASLHTSQNTVTWVLTAYLLSASICTPIIGRLGDMWGKERMMVVTLVVLAAGCVLAAVATSIGVMIIARVVQGVGGGVLPLAFGIIRDEFPRKKVAGAVGTLAALTAAGGGFGVVIAGPVVDALSYHWLFWIPTLMLCGASVATHLVIPESPVRTSGKVSWTAALLLAAWLVALLVPVSEATRWGWSSARVVGLLLVALGLAVAWVSVEQRAAHPLIDMQMMRTPIVWTNNLVALLFGVGMYATFAFVPQFLQTPTSAGYGFGASITVSGLLMLPSSAVMFVLATSTGRLTSRFSGKLVLVTGALTMTVAFVLLVTANTHRWEVVIAMMVMGAGTGLGFAAMSSLVVEGVPPEQTGVASGMNANIRTIGGSIGAAVMSTIVTGTTNRGYPAKAGYTHGFLFLSLAAVAAAVASFVVPATRRPSTPSTHPAQRPHAELGVVAAGTLIGDEPE
jgi:EmrB/QacA subfamily drug resistance transporter